MRGWPPLVVGTVDTHQEGLGFNSRLLAVSVRVLLQFSSTIIKSDDEVNIQSVPSTKRTDLKISEDDGLKNKITHVTNQVFFILSHTSAQVGKLYFPQGRGRQKQTPLSGSLTTEIYCLSCLKDSLKTLEAVV